MNPFEFRIVCHLLREGKAFSIESGANIGEMCGISRATVLRSLASLEAKGYVLILRVPGEANEYRVLVG
jgi:DNA-binding MarR family transcriptional regulator